LLDSGANGEAFISSKFYKPIKERLNPTLHKLPQAIQITSYNNQPTDTLRRAFQTDVLIDGRRTSTWFFFCDTGKHDVLLGRHWFKKTGALIDCKNRRLVWPDEAPYEASHQIVVLKGALFAPPLSSQRAKRSRPAGRPNRS
jgi:hypothetical protein